MSLQRERLNLQFRTLGEGGQLVEETDVPFAQVPFTGVANINAKCLNVDIEMCAFTIQLFYVKTVLWETTTNVYIIL